MVLTQSGGGYSFNPARHFPTHWESQMQQPGVPESLLQCTPSLPTTTHTPLLHGAGIALIFFLIQTRPQLRHLNARLHGNGVTPKMPMMLGGVNAPGAHLTL